MVVASREIAENLRRGGNISPEQEKMLRKIDKMERDITFQILQYLDDPSIIEIMLNPNGEVWLDSLTEGQKFSGYKMPKENAIAFLGSVADSLGETVSSQNTIIEGELLLDGSRIEGLIPPTVENPSFTIRKKASAIYTLEQYVEQGRLTQEFKEYIENCIKNKKNIIVTGSTGSGKTTLTNGLIDKISKITPNDRIIFIEDTIEIQCKQKNQVAMRTNLHTSLHDCVKATMRLRPDRIIIGEVRGAEALDLLKAWNTGHPGGITTVHSDSARKALSRLQMLIAEGIAAPMQTLIADAVDVVIFIEKTSIGPKITEIAEVLGYDAVKQDYEMKYLLKESGTGKTNKGQYEGQYEDQYERQYEKQYERQYEDQYQKQSQMQDRAAVAAQDTGGEREGQYKTQYKDQYEKQYEDRGAVTEQGKKDGKAQKDQVKIPASMMWATGGAVFNEEVMKKIREENEID